MFTRKQEEDLLNEFGDKEGERESVKRWLVPAHLVRREMFGKVPHEQLLSSDPLAMQELPLPAVGQSPRGAQAWHARGHQGHVAEKAPKAPVLSQGRRRPAVCLPWGGIPCCSAVC